MAKSIKDFISGEYLMAAREQYFATLALSVMVARNGDAHLKNFGVLYNQPQSAVWLAPVYDVVTSSAYIKNDVPALTLAGTKKWWPRKMLEQFAVAHLSLPAKTVSATFNRMAETVTETRAMIPGYITAHPEFREIGERMMDLWNEGINGLSALNKHFNKNIL